MENTTPYVQILLRCWFGNRIPLNFESAMPTERKNCKNNIVRWSRTCVSFSSTYWTLPYYYVVQILISLISMKNQVDSVIVGKIYLAHLFLKLIFFWEKYDFNFELGLFLVHFILLVGPSRFTSMWSVYYWTSLLKTITVLKSNNNTNKSTWSIWNIL